MPIRPGSTSRSRTLRRALLAIALPAVLVLSACTGGGSNSDSASGDETVTIVAADNSMSWALDYTITPGWEQQSNVQATLLKKPYAETDQAGVETQVADEFEPYLADSMDISDDGLVYTFHLRDVVSAQGNELTSEDVRWSFERKFNSPTSIAFGIAAPVWYDPDEMIDVIDDKTVSFTLTSAGYGATFQALMADLFSYIYDSTYLKENATEDDPYAVEFSATHPNHGFGPYEVTSFDQATGATLEALPDYAPGEPAVKKVVVRIVPDAGSRAAAVTSGSADIAENVDPATLAAEGDSEDVIVPYIANTNEFLLFPLVTTQEPFDNKLVRQAMAYAVPYDQIIENVFHGLASRTGSGFLDPEAAGYDGDGLPEYSYDPEKALELLDEAGIETPVPVTISVSSADADSMNTAIQIQSGAADAGFDITIDEVSPSEFSEQRAAHQFQSFLMRDWAVTMTPPYELLIHTAAGTSNNMADWEYQPYYDAVDAGYALPDAFSDEAGKAWNAAEQILLEETPIIYVARVQPAVLISSDIEGYAKRSDQMLDYSNLQIAD